MDLPRYYNQWHCCRNTSNQKQHLQGNIWKVTGGCFAWFIQVIDPLSWSHNLALTTANHSYLLWSASAGVLKFLCLEPMATAAAAAPPPPPPATTTTTTTTTTRTRRTHHLGLGAPLKPFCPTQPQLNFGRTALLQVPRDPPIVASPWEVSLLGSWLHLHQGESRYKPRVYPGFV